MSDFIKIFLKGGVIEKLFDRGSVLKVSLHVDDLIDKIKSGEITCGVAGYVYFDIIKKKEPPQGENESTHYMVVSKKVEGGSATSSMPTRQATTPPPTQNTYNNDDLPF